MIPKGIHQSRANIMVIHPLNEARVHIPKVSRTSSRIDSDDSLTMFMNHYSLGIFTGIRCILMIQRLQKHTTVSLGNIFEDNAMYNT